MRKKGKKKIETVPPDVMEKYKKLRKDTFEAYGFPLLLFLLLPDRNFMEILTPILQIPSLVMAIITVKMYNKFPKKAKKETEFELLASSPIEFHPYVAVGLILLTQIAFLLTAIDHLLK